MLFWLCNSSRVEEEDGTYEITSDLCLCGAEMLNSALESGDYRICGGYYKRSYSRSDMSLPSIDSRAMSETGKT